MVGIIDERERHDLHTWAVETMGDNRADIFMRSLPPRGWDELVTKDDLQVAKHELRNDMQAANHELRVDLQAAEHELRADLQAAKHELRDDMHRESNKLLVALVASMLAATLGQEMIVRWFPPPPPQIILQPATP